MSALTAKEKLRLLGIRPATTQNNPYRSTFEAIAEAKDYSTFSSDVGGLGDYAAFETYLEDTIGISDDDAARFRNRMEQKYTSFSDFQNTLSGFSSYAEWKSTFSWGTTLGGDTITGTGGVGAGMRIHAEDGVTYDDISVEKGTVEVFGPRVEFSERSSPIDATTSFSTANLTVSDTEPAPTFAISIEADVTNSSGFETDYTTTLFEDGEAVKSKTHTYGASETKTVSFTRTYYEFKEVDVKVNEAGPVTVTVVPESVSL